MGDLPQALALRLTDSNVKVAQSALNLCELISKAMGPPCKQYIKMFLPGCLQGDFVKNFNLKANYFAVKPFSQFFIYLCFD